jgi:hypothetical protein
MVLLVVSSTVRYQKLSPRQCATYGLVFIVNENNRKLRDQCVSTQVHVTVTVQNNKLLGLSHNKVS